MLGSKGQSPKSNGAGRWTHRLLRLDQAALQADLSAQLTEASRPNFAFFFMLFMAAAIATFGLLSNSAPAIIGAMIIAPLMEPIVGVSLGTLTGNRKLVSLSVISIATGSAAVVGLAFVLTKLMGLSVVGDEVMARTAPSTIDFLIALFSGGAAAFAHSRLNIANSIAGVAIAVALVPPLATCGVGLALGDIAVTEDGTAPSHLLDGNPGFAMAAGAFLLFMTNIVGIVAFATVVFALQKYGHYRRPLYLAVGLLAATVVMIGPLEQRFKIVYLEDLVLEAYSRLVASDPPLFSSHGHIDHVAVVRDGEKLVITIRIFELTSAMSRMNEAAAAFERALSEETKRPVTLKLKVVPTRMEIFPADGEVPGEKRPARHREAG